MIFESFSRLDSVSDYCLLILLISSISNLPFTFSMENISEMFTLIPLKIHCTFLILNTPWIGI